MRKILPPGVSSRRLFLYLTALLLHFALIASICVYTTFWLAEEKAFGRATDVRTLTRALRSLPAGILGADLPAANPFRQTISTYTHLSGIQVGYGYFGPNVPPPYQLVFEYFLPDGRLAYHVPSLEGREGQLRVAGLMQEIGSTDYEPWRLRLVEMLARADSRLYPGAIHQRAYLGWISSPTSREMIAGKKEHTFHCLHVYDLDPGEHRNTAEGK